MDSIAIYFPGALMYLANSGKLETVLVSAKGLVGTASNFWLSVRYSKDEHKTSSVMLP